MCVQEDMSTAQTQLSEVRSNQKDLQRDLDLMQSTQYRSFTVSVKLLNILLQFMPQYVKHHIKSNTASLAFSLHSKYINMLDD